MDRHSHKLVLALGMVAGILIGMLIGVSLPGSEDLATAVQPQEVIYRITGDVGTTDKVVLYSGIERAEARFAYHDAVGRGFGPRIEMIEDAGTDNFAEDPVILLLEIADDELVVSTGMKIIPIGQTTEEAPGC